MNELIPPFIGYTCAYTPFPLIWAAGFTPYRILPVGNAPESAGQTLHDNLCPQVKRVLDRALSQDLPLLVLEGDCTLRSLGQYRTRLEAFAEMIGDRLP